MEAGERRLHAVVLEHDAHHHQVDQVAVDAVHRAGEEHGHHLDEAQSAGDERELEVRYHGYLPPEGVEDLCYRPRHGQSQKQNAE